MRGSRLEIGRNWGHKLVCVSSCFQLCSDPASEALEGRIGQAMESWMRCRVLACLNLVRIPVFRFLPFPLVGF